MNIYDDYQRFKEKTETEHINYKNMSSTKTQYELSNNPIFEQLANINNGNLASSEQSQTDYSPSSENNEFITALKESENNQENKETVQSSFSTTVLQAQGSQINAQSLNDTASDEPKKEIPLQSMLKRISSCQ